jgi:hypothetical protein
MEERRSGRADAAAVSAALRRQPLPLTTNTCKGGGPLGGKTVKGSSAENDDRENGGRAGLSRGEAPPRRLTRRSLHAFTDDRAFLAPSITKTTANRPTTSKPGNVNSPFLPPPAPPRSVTVPPPFLPSISLRPGAAKAQCEDENESKPKGGGEEGEGSGS